MPRALRILLGLAALGTMFGIGAVALVFHWANGLTLGSVALSSLAFAAGLSVIALGKSAARRPARIIVAVILLADAGWAVARIARSGGTAVQVCEGGACDGRGRFWQRVPDERELARFGLYLSKLTGSMHGAEARHFDELLDAQYAALPDSWRGLPNSLLLSSPQRLQHVPPGAKKAPCIVFLHGFGGELSLYLQAMVDSELGREFVIVAPVLDNFGIWWSARGMDLLVSTLDSLPPEADRSRVILVGLSNGAIGATSMLQQSKIDVAATVLISGAGTMNQEARIDGKRVLAIAGRDDPRFPFDYVERQTVALRAAGADVELVELPADHFLLITHGPEWTHRVYLMGTSLGRGSSDGIGSP